MLNVTLHTLHVTLHIRHVTLHCQRALHSILYTLNFTLHTLHCALRSPHFTPTLYTWHSTLYVYTWHSQFNLYAFALYTLHFTLDPHNFALFTLDCMEPWPSSIVMLRAHIYLSSWTFAARCVISSHASKGPLRCRRWTFEFSPTLCTLHSAFYTPHFTL